MSKEIFISIANQKGGVGKSTLTTIIANLLHFEHGYTVAVVDCDSPQASTADLRDFEIKVIRNSPYFNELAAKHFKKYGKNAFQIIRSTAAEALDDAEDLLRNSDPRHRALRPSGFVEYKRSNHNPLTDGLHLHSDVCRPFGGGEYLAVCFAVQ